MRNLFILLAGVILLGSCNTNYEKTKSGLRYKIIKGKGGKQLQPGDYIQYDQVVLIPERDTILFSTYGKMHGYEKIDTGARVAYSYQEVLPKMKVGDSLVVVMSVDSLVSKKMIPAYNEILRRGDMLTFRMRVTKSYATEAEIQADAEKDRAQAAEREAKEQEETKKKEIAEIESYLKKNNINAVKTPSGAFVEVQQKGTGPVGDTGAIAQVFYTGKLFKEGTAFDSNIDPKFNHTDALQVPLGQGGMITGFAEGLMYFGKGGKGRIFIPSALGYGKMGSPPVIPPSSNLIFEVEIRDISPAPPAGPAMPPIGH